MSGPVLRVRSLVKRWGGIVATDHVDLDVDSHEIHALIGPNGAGKTTFVNQLAGSLRSNSGTIEFLGRDISRLAHSSSRACGYRAVASDHERVQEIHGAAQRAAGRAGARQQRIELSLHGLSVQEDALLEAARAVILSVGLKGREDTPAATLSHGEQRKLEIALALATNPTLLLLDEPLAGMGPADAQDMVSLIEKLKSQVTMVLVEHDMGAVFRLADRITVLVYGKVIATDVPSAIRASPAVRKAYLGEEAVA